MQKTVYITHAKRTAIGSLLGSLKELAAHSLGALVIKDILNISKLDPALIDEVIMGQVLTGGSGQNPARQALIAAHIPKETPALTLNQVCGSGVKAVCLAAQSIGNGDNHVVIAGGQENMSLAMHGSYIRSGQKFGSLKLLDFMQYDGLTDAFSGQAMGVTAENIAKQFNISREMQDEFAYLSQQKATQALKNGVFKEEIIPVEIIAKKQTIVFAEDEGIKPATDITGLAKLKPAFDPKGSVTAGNSSTINDGAAGLLVVSEEALKKHDLKPLVRIVSYANVGVEPSIMGTGPVPASHKALEKAGWNIDDLDVIECNEAFAAQAIYVNQNMRWNIKKVNINGGAIALGHPIGASGARILVSLIHQMHRMPNAKKGLATLCVGGGMGLAICLEKV